MRSIFAAIRDRRADTFTDRVREAFGARIDATAAAVAEDRADTDDLTGRVASALDREARIRAATAEQRANPRTEDEILDSIESKLDQVLASLDRAAR